MTREEFDNLPKEYKDAMINDMLKLETICELHPINMEGIIKITETITEIELGYDTELISNLLKGMYPNERLNQTLSYTEMQEVLRLSNRAKNFVNFWNESCVRKMSMEYYNQI